MKYALATLTSHPVSLSKTGTAYVPLLIHSFHCIAQSVCYDTGESDSQGAFFLGEGLRHRQICKPQGTEELRDPCKADGGER